MQVHSFIQYCFQKHTVKGFPFQFLTLCLITLLFQRWLVSTDQVNQHQTPPIILPSFCPPPRGADSANLSPASIAIGRDIGPRSEHLTSCRFSCHQHFHFNLGLPQIRHPPHFCTPPLELILFAACHYYTAAPRLNDSMFWFNYELIIYSWLIHVRWW